LEEDDEEEAEARRGVKKKKSVDNLCRLQAVDDKYLQINESST
jgi:hypothetical protein